MRVCLCEVCVCVCVRVNARYVRAEVCVHEHVVCLGLANHTTS